MTSLKWLIITICEKTFTSANVFAIFANADLISSLCDTNSNLDSLKPCVIYNCVTSLCNAICLWMSFPLCCQSDRFLNLVVKFHNLLLAIFAAPILQEYYGLEFKRCIKHQFCKSIMDLKFFNSSNGLKIS